VREGDLVGAHELVAMHHLHVAAEDGPLGFLHVQRVCLDVGRRVPARCRGGVQFGEQGQRARRAAQQPVRLRRFLGLHGGGNGEAQRQQSQGGSAHHGFLRTQWPPF
jgi:hypothetical protein